MRFLFYTHSLVSDWNHGNAHFLRGVMRDLKRRGHDTQALEPEGSWSRDNLLNDQGEAPITAFHETFPDLVSEVYGVDFDHEAALDGADVVVVHEWTEPALVERIGKARRNGGRFTLIFHDTLPAGRLGRAGVYLARGRRRHDFSRHAGGGKDRRPDLGRQLGG
jgi:spore maturation protein CgeB